MTHSKKNVARLIISLILAVALILSLASCSLEDITAGVKDVVGEDIYKVISDLLGTSDTEDHKHTFTNVYSFDDEYHWFSATCEHTDEKKDVTEHTYESGSCICGKNEPKAPADPETPDTPEEPDSPDQPDTPETPEGYSVITIAEALELCGESGNITTERYYIRAIIKTVINPQYGNMVIEDETGSISVYGTYSADGSLTYPELDYQPVKGDEVLLYCILQNYNGTKEVKNARLIEYKNNQGNIDASDYEKVTIAEAREAEKGDLVKVSGVVARITYANGYKPSGFILIDGTSSIYVYDGDAAGRVEIGNTVEIAGKKDYWILEKEQSAAEKHGYEGCSQITEVLFISNDSKVSAFDTSWIEETNVKDLLATPVTEDITSLVYKVNALVKKVPNTSFVNYYFFDIDGDTGAYTYTQCNGGDFEWLDEFDGKICTVYLTALNAKSESTACFYRLLPIAVYDEGYQFDTSKVGEYAIKYELRDQFFPVYTGDPALEVLNVVSSDLLGFEGATVVYTSNNTASVSFTTTNGVTVMNCNAAGTATVTITVTYNGVPYSETVEITVDIPASDGAITVADAIATELNEIITVKGIVGPSVINKNGFYLMDDTGLIAVLVNNVETLGTIELGQEIIIEGKRDKFHNGNGNHAGQTCITAAEVVSNLYGNHSYDTSKFVTGLTVTDFYNLDETVDYTTTVFILTGKVIEVTNGRASSYKLTDGTKHTNLYAGGTAQYAFLEDYLDQELTFEVAACNWNNKSYYAACILSVTLADGTKIYNTYHFDNN